MTGSLGRGAATARLRQDADNSEVRQNQKPVEILASGFLCGSVCPAANQSRPVREALDLSGFAQRLVAARQRQPVAEAHALLLQRGRTDVKKKRGAGRRLKHAPRTRTHLLWVG